MWKVRPEMQNSSEKKKSFRGAIKSWLIKHPGKRLCQKSNFFKILFIYIGLLLFVRSCIRLLLNSNLSNNSLFFIILLCRQSVNECGQCFILSTVSFFTCLETGSAKKKSWVLFKLWLKSFCRKKKDEVGKTHRKTQKRGIILFKLQTNKKQFDSFFKNTLSK